MPMMSLVIVMKGPVAMAGFILNLSNTMGIIVPKVLANMMTENRLMETDKVMRWSPSVK
jgi:hypothetical protein